MEKENSYKSLSTKVSGQMASFSSSHENNNQSDSVDSKEIISKFNQTLDFINSNEIFKGITSLLKEKITKISENIKSNNNEINKNSILLLSGSCDNKIKLWDLKTLNCIKTFEGHQSYIWNLIQMDKTTFATCSYDKTIKIWDLTRNECIQTYKSNEIIYSLIKITPYCIVYGGKENSIKTLNIINGEKKYYEGHTNSVYCLTNISSNLFASGSYDSTIKIWNKNNDSIHCLKTLTGHTEKVLSIIRIDDNIIASGSYDRTIKIWNISHENNNCIKSINTNTKYLFNLAKINDHIIASQGAINEIHLWNIITGFKTETYRGHKKYILNLLYIKKFNFLISSSADKTIRIWDLTKKGCEVLRGHTEDIYALMNFDEDYNN